MISIETAHSILATFGITKPTRAYERWVKPDGFDLRDFTDVLYESPFVFVVDWRACLDEELDTISETLKELGHALTVKLDDEGIRGTVGGANGKAAVKYVPNDDDDFDAVIRAIQAVIGPNIEFRASPHNHEGDTLVYGVLPTDEWEELDKIAFPAISQLFVPLA